MDAPQPEPGEPRTSAPLVRDRPTRGRGWTLLLPAIAFLLGLLLGGVLIGASRDDGTSAAGGSPTPLPSATTSPAAADVTVTVPGPCVQAANRANDAYALVDRGVRAARDLDARALADLVAEVQRERPQVQQLIAQCQAAAGNQLVSPGPSPLPSPVPTG